MKKTQRCDRDGFVRENVSETLSLLKTQTTVELLHRMIVTNNFFFYDLAIFVNSFRFTFHRSRRGERVVLIRVWLFFPPDDIVSTVDGPACDR